ncbi:SLC13 family permease [Haliea sp. E17]|uniref:SLC13 family permease n=1 Tax=Haliea sp. E17 TaxID=3401576 RepID=UPI003AAC8046
MQNDTLFVFILIGVAGVLMASNRVRFDVVALLVVLALSLSGVLTVEEAIAGFGSPVVALVAGLLVVGEMLSRTGVARVVGDWVLKRGGESEARVLVLLMGCAALLGSVMSSTVVVALFIPVVLRIAAQTRLNASRLLIPLSYAALISGMLTLIGTTPNIVVHEQLRSAGYDGFGFFSFSPVGLAVLAICILYILLAGRHMLGAPVSEPTRDDRGKSLRDLWGQHNPWGRYQKVCVGEHSLLAGKSLEDARLDTEYKVRVIGVLRRSGTGRRRIASPAADTELSPGTTLLVFGRPEQVDRLARDQVLVKVPYSPADRERWRWDISGAAVLIHPDSQLLGESLRECGFRSKYGIHVLGIRRNGKALEDFEDALLHTGDSLFVVGAWARVQQLSQHAHDFVVTDLPREHRESVPQYNKIRLSLLILAGMVALTLFNIVPLIPAVMIAALAAVFTRCLSMEEAYRAIPWSSLVLIAGMLPLAYALEKTGGIDLVAATLMRLSADAGPYMLMTLVFFLTASIGLVLSNTAAAVLVAPIAIAAAAAIGASPYPFAVAVVIAASSSFSTPVATPVVTLVVEPGHYVFADFLKVGLPLLLLTYAVTLAVTPLLFPF